MTTAKRWETRQVRAYNVKPGDVIGFFDIKRRVEVRKTVNLVENDRNYEDHVVIRFRRGRGITTWGLSIPRMKLMRIRRMLPK